MAAALPRLTSRGERSEATSGGRGEFSPMSGGRARFHEVTGLTRTANPYAAGFQICIFDSTGMNSVWAANPGKRRGSRPGYGLPN